MYWAISVTAAALALLALWLAWKLDKTAKAAEHWRMQAEAFQQAAKSMEQELADACKRAGRDDDLMRELRNIFRYDGTAASQEALRDE